MFTGIVECTGSVQRVQTTASGVRLSIDGGSWPHRLEAGASICVSGVCLTHAPGMDEQGQAGLSFDVIPQTLVRTTLGDLAAGDLVNLEPPLAAGAPLSGHITQGHVDGVGTVSEVTRGDDCRLGIRTPPELMPYVVPKGSIAVDGVSLTIAAVSDDAFEVALIPTTLQRTTLGRAELGTRVNLETDIVSKTVVHWLERRRGADETVTRQVLRDAGFEA